MAPVSRRRFCQYLGGWGALGLVRVAAAADDIQPKLRVIAYNIYVGKGWPGDRRLAEQAVRKGQMARRLAMELALYDPDVITFSESPSEKITREIADLLGMHHVRFPSGGHWPGTLLSRHEIVESMNVPLERERPSDLFTRHWGRATIRLPQGELLVVHSAHLMPPNETEVPARLEEIRAMLASMKDDFAAGRSMILMGDLNHGPGTEEYRLWMEGGWVDTFAKAGHGEGLTFKADAPQRRIDYVMAHGPIAERIIESRPLFEGAFRLNTSDEKAFSLSDHLPLLAVFRMK